MPRFTRRWHRHRASRRSGFGCRACRALRASGARRTRLRARPDALRRDRAARRTRLRLAEDGRAVSREAGAEWHDKMLALPAFLRRGETTGADRGAIDQAFRLTGFFLTRHVYEPRGITDRRHAPASSPPCARQWPIHSRMARPPHSEVECCRAVSRRPASIPLPTRMARAGPGLTYCGSPLSRSPRALNWAHDRHNHSTGQG